MLCERAKYTQSDMVDRLNKQNVWRSCRLTSKFLSRKSY